MQALKRVPILLCGGLVLATWSATAVSQASTQDVNPGLIRFVQAVVNDNPQVQAARLALESSTALKSAAARPLFNPELAIEAENSDSDTRALGLSQRLDWGGKRSARAAVAEAERLTAEAEYVLVRWSVTVELLNALAGYQTGVERDKLAAARTGLMDDFADIAQRRFQAGDLTQVELDLASLAFTDARIQKATAAAGLAEARQGMRNLSPGPAASQWPALPARLPQLPRNAGENQSMVLMLPAVVVAQYRVDAAEALVELRRRERRPDPTLSLTGGKEDDETLIGLSLSVPLFVRNRFSHEVTAAIARGGQAQQLANDVIQRAVARLTSASDIYELSNAAWQDWGRTGQASLDRQGQQLRRLWRAGELSTTEYLVQIRQTLDVQERALDLRHTLWRAWFEWLEASGNVDTWLGQEPLR